MDHPAPRARLESGSVLPGEGGFRLRGGGSPPLAVPLGPVSAGRQRVPKWAQGGEAPAHQGPLCLCPGCPQVHTGSGRGGDPAFQVAASWEEGWGGQLQAFWREPQGGRDMGREGVSRARTVSSGCRGAGGTGSPGSPGFLSNQNQAWGPPVGAPGALGLGLLVGWPTYALSASPSSLLHFPQHHC